MFQDGSLRHRVREGLTSVTSNPAICNLAIAGNDWYISDVDVGALTYALEILIGVVGCARRWRTMPWLAVAFVKRYTLFLQSRCAFACDDAFGQAAICLAFREAMFARKRGLAHLARPQQHALKAAFTGSDAPPVVPKTDSSLWRRYFMGVSRW